LVKIAGSAFVETGITSLTARGFSTTGSLFMHLGKDVRCLGRPRSVVIPSTVREIGESAFHFVSSLEDLRFKQGVERIKSSAFHWCCGLRAVAFPASLVVIDEYAFAYCGQLGRVEFAADSKLRYIGKDAFSECPLERVSLPASVIDVDAFAFSAEVWKIVKSHLLLDRDFLCSRDSRTMLRCGSGDMKIEVPAHIEVIGKMAFQGCHLATSILATESRLREIREDRCFAQCDDLVTVTFEENSNLKKIRERAFADCAIRSFRIPASVNEIDGSAFVGCPLEDIDIDPGNRSFIVRGNTLLTSDGTGIVRSFGLEREIFVPSEVEVLHNSCFESLYRLTEVEFASGSKLRKICRSALSDCDSLRSIVVPDSVTEIEEFAFKDCIGLEECSMHKYAILVRIGEEAFTGCSCLRSFYAPKTIAEIGEDCFKRCSSLTQLKFGSGQTLKRIVRDKTLDEVLEYLGVTEISGLLRIEVEEDVFNLEFPGWIPVADEGIHLTLARASR
jgi:hypothetical protein